MGQQQLLLLVFGVVIVGLAIAAGIHSFMEGQTKTQQEAAMSEALRIASHVQDWKSRPRAFGGGGATTQQNFEEVTLRAIGVTTEEPDGPYVTSYGCYILSGSSSGATLSVYRDSISSACDTATEVASLFISGIHPQDINWSYK